jgi:hypothetical protein
MKKCLFIVLLGVTLSACSSLSEQPSSRSLFQPAMSHMSSGKARITFVRNRNDNSVPIITALSIDDWVVATLGPGQKTTLEVDAGLRYVGLKGKNTPMTLKPARDYFFYIELNKEGTQYELHSVLKSTTKHLHNS